MKTCFPVVVGKICLRLRKCFWHFLSRPIVGSLMMKGKYILYTQSIKNCYITILRYFYKIMLFCTYPILLHSDESSLIQDRSDQWIHLGHVASKPEQPTTNSN